MNKLDSRKFWYYEDKFQDYKARFWVTKFMIIIYFVKKFIHKIKLQSQSFNFKKLTKFHIMFLDDLILDKEGLNNN